MPSTAEKYLRPEVIRQVGRLDLRAKFIVEGFIAGLHQSPYHGFSVEFSEHRKYVPGDDLKDIDWNVLATQNPIEQEGTYPLPEAQLDRFMFNIKVDYPSLAEEEQILTATTRGDSVELKKVLTGRAILNVQKLVTNVAVSEFVVKYVAKLVRATRPNDKTAPQFVKEMVDWGAGPRAGQFLIMGAKAMAAMDGRFSVALEDIRKVATPVLRHRISTNFQAQAEGCSSEDLVSRLVNEIPEPEIPKYERR